MLYLNVKRWGMLVSGHNIHSLTQSHSTTTTHLCGTNSFRAFGCWAFDICHFALDYLQFEIFAQALIEESVGGGGRS